MRGRLIVNHFVKNDKFGELFAMLEAAAAPFDVELKRCSNSAMWLELARSGYELKDKPDFILFWDKDVRLAYELERQGLRVYNPASAIEDCDDKTLTWLKCEHAGIRQPKSIISPKKFHADGLMDEELAATVRERIGFPCVVKEAFGSFGQQVRLAYDESELIACIRECGDRPYIIQEYIASSEGRDIRLQVVGDKVIAAMLRENANDFRANITNGGTATDYTSRVSDAQKQMALDACRVLNLDFAGVDILFGPDDEPVLCEVNSNAHFKNLFDCTGINAAEAIMEHIVKDPSLRSG